MKSLDLTFPSPEENLACDEALLDQCEEGYPHEILRFWEPRSYFAVLGYSNRPDTELDLNACRKSKVPVLRRCSGGGTVLEGPGCLNFSLLLNIASRQELKGVQRTNAFVMKQHQEALETLLSGRVRIQGTSDLTLNDRKFSGNAQRRKRNWVLFHGTFLISLDIQQVEQCLRHPEKQPDYRRSRSHSDFLTNIGLSTTTLKEALQKKWDAKDPLDEIPHDRIQRLVKTHYGSETWTLRDVR